MEKTGYIYKVTCLSNDKVYIGQTRRSVKLRGKEHCYSAEHNLEKNSKLHRAISKYGEENFTIEILGQGTGKDETLIKVLDALEIAFIKYYNSAESGYNITIGGTGGKLLHKKTENKKEYDRIYWKKYEQEHKEEIRARAKERERIRRLKRQWTDAPDRGDKWQEAHKLEFEERKRVYREQISCQEKAAQAENVKK